MVLISSQSYAVFHKISELPLYNFGAWIEIDNDLAIIGTAENSLFFVDISNPENPTIRISRELDTGVNHSRTYTLNGGTTQWWIFYESGTPDKYYNYKTQHAMKSLFLLFVYSSSVNSSFCFPLIILCLPHLAFSTLIPSSSQLWITLSISF